MIGKAGPNVRAVDSTSKRHVRMKPMGLDIESRHDSRIEVVPQCKNASFEQNAKARPVYTDFYKKQRNDAEEVRSEMEGPRVAFFVIEIAIVNHRLISSP